jgi:hypothetical protein
MAPHRGQSIIHRVFGEVVNHRPILVLLAALVLGLSAACDCPPRLKIVNRGLAKVTNSDSYAGLGYTNAWVIVDGVRFDVLYLQDGYGTTPVQFVEEGDEHSVQFVWEDPASGGRHTREITNKPANTFDFKRKESYALLVPGFLIEAGASYPLDP